MKKLLTLGCVLSVLSPMAFATKSRLQALGEDKDGSYYIADYRNVYINPSELNSLGNMAVLEWGDAGKNFNGAGRGDYASLDPDNKPKAQGGVVHSLSNGMKLGVILGDETDVAALTRILASNGATKFLRTADNVLDLFVAGQSSVNWGANLLYTKSKDDVNGFTQDAMAARFGASQGAWNAHMLLALGAKADSAATADSKYKGKFGARIGGGYDLNAESKAFGMYESYSWKQSLNANNVEREGSFNKAILGVGHTKKISDNSTLFAKLQGELVNIKLDTSSVATTAAKINRLSFPVSFGFEHNATEWLVVRGSVVQNIYGTVKDEGLQTNFGTAGLGSTGAITRSLAAARYGSSTSGAGGKQTLANSTAVNAGMTLKFGKLSVDGNIGTTDGGRQAADGASTAAADTRHGVLALDNLETRVGMTYNF